MYGAFEGVCTHGFTMGRTSTFSASPTSTVIERLTPGRGWRAYKSLPAPRKGCAMWANEVACRKGLLMEVERATRTTVKVVGPKFGPSTPAQPRLTRRRHIQPYDAVAQRL